MEEIWAKDGEREPLPTSLLSMHYGSWVPGSQTGKDFHQLQLHVFIKTLALVTEIEQGSNQNY